jgi:hypothetical protein
MLVDSAARVRLRSGSARAQATSRLRTRGSACDRSPLAPLAGDVSPRLEGEVKPTAALLATIGLTLTIAACGGGGSGVETVSCPPAASGATLVMVHGHPQLVDCEHGSGLWHNPGWYHP